MLDRLLSTGDITPIISESRLHPPRTDTQIGGAILQTTISPCCKPRTGMSLRENISNEKSNLNLLNQELWDPTDYPSCPMFCNANNLSFSLQAMGVSTSLEGSLSTDGLFPMLSVNGLWTWHTRGSDHATSPDSSGSPMDVSQKSLAGENSSNMPCLKESIHKKILCVKDFLGDTCDLWPIGIW